MPPNIVITGKQCCGIVLRNMGTESILEAYITEDSSTNPYDPNYDPYVNETDEDDYYVPEYYDPDNIMPPRKFSEDSEAPDLNAFSSFVGIQDDGMGNFVNYRFTPAQFIAYWGAQSSNLITLEAADISTVTNTDDTYTDDWFDGRVIKKILTNNQILLRSVDFTQSGDAITLLNGGAWYDAQVALFEI